MMTCTDGHVEYATDGLEQHGPLARESRPLPIHRACVSLAGRLVSSSALSVDVRKLSITERTDWYPFSPFK
ncbi:MAG: hypothetical protein ACE361_26930 [Aureliella sp.]